MSRKLLRATLPKNENLCMRMKAILPDTIARAGEPDPMCEKSCNAQDFRCLHFAVMQICDTRKSGNRKIAVKWRKSHPTTQEANFSKSKWG